MSLSIFNLLGLSCQSLMGNPLRSTLSAIGVFMGVAVVTATMQVRNISEAVIEQQMNERESPILYLWISDHQSGKVQSFTMDDVEFLNNNLQGITKVMTLRFVWWIDSVQFQDRTGHPEVAIAVTPEYQQVSGRRIIKGRFFNSTDVEQYLSVAIVDDVLANHLFDNMDPINQRVYIENRPYTIVGVIESKDIFPSMQRQGLLMIPLSLDMAITGNLQLDELMIGIQDLDNVDQIKTQAISILQKRIPTQQYGDWVNITDILEQRETLASISQALLVVSIIALLVGGVGIANVTIAAVIQRTPEIGLKRAIGATRFEIMLQFILEVVIISLGAGILAIATVHGVTIMVSQRFNLPYTIDYNTAKLSLTSSLIIGVSSALFPAIRASKIEPVQALKGD
ncbi:MAG: ABC transporter permease [Limnospira sp. PMC 1291.21]|uniref:ABC transporter permease n=1 Tax=unclassified Limnospira TaxID=2642885 RepID=UPI0028E16F73|nr:MULTISPECIES: ABC transporter permease [unclassified Limnospira]MDT9179265.1 ABC transporter permease [Limnospira sp. PMC 1238.20]MDT9193627.1 ABC transporter permease [Limnospira sp. PMC 1245.20]MDT9203928.1 ABC transporter permease [Limnospira sp. PMC 1243.20]MDT9209899.1 ABC transporter permease [Limnospira sp. PMC 1252.20]MDT9215067.1 ABC transporter permease [Limnospira sp. PMC 1256.20]